MYRTLVAIYSRLPDAAALRRELEEFGLPSDHVQISSESGTAAASAAAESGGMAVKDEAWPHGRASTTK